MSARYAIYFVPEHTSGLAIFGAGVLGRDALNRPQASHQPDHPMRAELVARASLYGFHATLKAPFELAASLSERVLKERLAALSSELESVPLTRLQPCRFGNFHALALPEPASAAHVAVAQLASRCVRDSVSWHAPLSEADIKRRNPNALSERQRRYLMEFGYPHVLDDFRFHMTLSGPTDNRDYIDWLQDHFHRLVPETPQLDRLSLCWQPDRTTPFQELAAYPLCSSGTTQER